MDTGILLENGTNEVEILEFKIGNNFYGINIAKVKEILPYKRPTPIPNAHPCIEGIFMPRDSVIAVVDLERCLKLSHADEELQEMIIITNFNKINVAFHVQAVVGIHRVTWDKIAKPDETLNDDDHGVATGFIKFDDKILVLLDFEKIITDINPESGLRVSEINKMSDRQRSESPILIAEDSVLMNNLIVESLKKAGYVNVISTTNGLEAWEKLKEFKMNNNIKSNVKCVITDIEMPQIDGHHLSKLIKSDSQLKEIPVIIFSTLINNESSKKAEIYGADAQLSKPEIASLVDIVDELILK